MFRDQKEALERLEAALLDSEDAEETASQEADDTFEEAVPEFDAYNTDVTDEDLDALSDALLEPEPERSSLGLIAAVIVLLTAIICVLVWFVLHYGGFLG